MDGDMTALYSHGEPVSSVQESEYGSGGRQEAFFKGAKMPSQLCLLAL